jgi:hypothetical protein
MHDVTVFIQHNKEAEVTIYLNGDNPSFRMTFASIEDIEKFVNNFKSEISRAKQEFIRSQEFQMRMAKVLKMVDIV